MSLPKYSCYEAVEAKGINRKPEHWDASRLRFVLTLNPSKQEAKGLGEQEMVSFLPMEAIGEDGSLRLEYEKELGECLTGYTYFRDGDVCVAKITPCFENGKGAILRGLKGGLGFGTTELIVARPRGGMITAEFLDYLFRSQVFRSLGESEMYGAGGQKRVPDSFVRDFVALIPSTDEQNQVTNFLNRETAKIDALIAEQQRLIELLQEKRQAVISHAVTKGLNPNAPMKDSGVEWLGEVPEHWLVNRFKLSIESCMNGVWGDEESSNENDVICIRVADFDRLRLEAKEPEEPTIRNVSDRDIEQRSLRNGDLLIEKSGGGEKQPVGAAVLYVGKSPSVCSNFVARMRLRKNMIPSFWRYAHYSAYSLRINTKSIKQTSGIQNLDHHQYFNEKVAYPPFEEQQEIANFLDHESSKTDSLVTQQQRLIALLQERHLALISAAVTGQIDVRGLVEEEGSEQ